MSAGQIYTGSGVDSVIITGSLVGATIRLDNTDGSEEAADSITVGNISSGVVYGESGADSLHSEIARLPSLVVVKTIRSLSVDLFHLPLLMVKAAPIVSSSPM